MESNTPQTSPPRRIRPMMMAADLVARVRGRFRRRAGKSEVTHFDMASHRLEPSERKRLMDESRSDLARLLYGHEGRLLWKWTHYADLYDRHFGPYRGKPIRMLEIGVFEGGSLELWREYFGPQAIIFGIYINPDCATKADEPNQVRIGSQADPDFLKSVVAEMGGVDIVLDDGSHIAAHQRSAFAPCFRSSIPAVFMRWRTCTPLIGRVFILVDIVDPGRRSNSSKMRSTICTDGITINAGESSIDRRFWVFMCMIRSRLSKRVRNRRPSISSLVGERNRHDAPSGNLVRPQASRALEMPTGLPRYNPLSSWQIPKRDDGSCCEYHRKNKPSHRIIDRKH